MTGVQTCALPILGVGHKDSLFSPNDTRETKDCRFETIDYPVSWDSDSPNTSADGAFAFTTQASAKLVCPGIQISRAIFVAHMRVSFDSAFQAGPATVISPPYVYQQEADPAFFNEFHGDFSANERFENISGLMVKEFVASRVFLDAAAVTDAQGRLCRVRIAE